MKLNILICSLLLLVNLSFSQVSVVEAFPNLTFTRPVDIVSPPDGSDRLFVVCQDGEIYVFPNDSTITEKSLFFSLKDSVSRYGEEDGLLGLAFHPDFKDNGYFYVSYNPTGSPRSIIARYTVGSDPDLADQSTKEIILQFAQTQRNHNGGNIAFGPDGYLYAGFGDGGGEQTANRYNSQDLKTLLGNLLRIDVNNTSSYGNYSIPEDNPFAGNDSSYREEIYAYGFRNPWRWSFDPVTTWLWVGDVGQNTWEEVDIIQKGGNYGWPIMEGKHCFPPGSDNCDDTGLIYPIWDYNHDWGSAITGGYVYRGSKVPDLYGKYVYGDYGSGLVWTIDYDGVNDPDNQLLLSSEKLISSFGTDQNNELYFCDLGGGKIYKFYQPVVTELDPVVLSSPPNNSVDVQPENITFEWQKVSHALSYNFRLAAISEDSVLTGIVDSTSVKGESYTTSTQHYNALFYWQVQAVNNDVTGPWSEKWYFRIVALGIPDLLSPENNAQDIVSDTVLFNWTTVTGADNYRLEIAGNHNFNTLYFSTTSSDTFALVPLNADEGATFFWRVRSVAGEDSSLWSNNWSFTTAYSTSLGIPELLLPENNAQDVAGDTVFFDWKNVEGVESYRLEIAKTNDFETLYNSDTTSYSLALVPLNAAEGTTFFWRVRSLADGDSSYWSDTWSFTTEQITALENKGQGLTSYYLMQNYPNPFNPSTLIQYYLAKNSRVTLNIYDITGRLVATLVNGMQNQGQHTVTFNAEHLPSGVYYYRISTSTGFRQSRKMILLK